MKRKTRPDLKKLAGFFYEVGTMRKLARSHRQTLLTDDLSDNIASHSFRVTLIGWFLAHLEEADPHKVVTMCLFHDTGETRGGDQNWVHKRYVKVFEDEISSDQLKPLPFGGEIYKVHQEYDERISKEAIIAKDADLLDQIILLKEHAWYGSQEAIRWLHSSIEKNAQYKALKTASAKSLAKKIYSSRPSVWWDNLDTSKRR